MCSDWADFYDTHHSAHNYKCTDFWVYLYFPHPEIATLYSMCGSHSEGNKASGPIGTNTITVSFMTIGHEFQTLYLLNHSHETSCMLGYYRGRIFSNTCQCTLGLETTQILFVTGQHYSSNDMVKHRQTQEHQCPLHWCCHCGRSSAHLYSHLCMTCVCFVSAERT